MGKEMNTCITVDRAIKTYLTYHASNSRPNTVRAFTFTLEKFRDMFSGMDISAVSEGDVVAFLEMITEGVKQSTKSSRAATQASRGGMPLEIVSKVVLRHADLATTQRYLGTVNPDEARRWIEHLNG
jgi:site-specific recombinase XerD